MFHRTASSEKTSKQNTAASQDVASEEQVTETTTQGKEEERQTMSNEATNEAQNRPVDIPGNSPYQRPMTGGPAQYGYAGMQSGAQTQSSGRRLMIGEGITLSGEIEACDHLVVEGTVEAALKGAQVLDISENGTYYGTVEIENATIAGRFEGDIKVDGRLTVKSTGVIVGTVSYRELAVEAGATIDGKLAPLTATPAKAGKTTKANAGAADFSKSRAAAKQADEEEKLPFTGKATANA